MAGPRGVARDRTARGLLERRDRLATLATDPDATVVLVGSWGRSEVTSESDDDFMVLFEGPERDDAHPTIDAVAELLGGRALGAEEIFGRQVWLDDLRGKIGRDEDSNANLTRRMLLVLESVPLCGDATHARALAALVKGYLEANASIDLGKLPIVADEHELRLRAARGVGERGEVARADHAGLVDDQHRPGRKLHPTPERVAQSRDGRRVDPCLVAQFARGAGRERAPEHRHTARLPGFASSVECERLAGARRGTDDLYAVAAARERTHEAALLVAEGGPTVDSGVEIALRGQGNPRSRDRFRQPSARRIALRR